MDDKINKVDITSSPHLHKKVNVKTIMLDVIIALIPAIIASIIFFGLNSVRIIVLTTIFTILSEYILQKIMKLKVRIRDLSAVVTGILLALNLPSNSPWWICLVGAFVAIGLGKMVFGGLGQNPFNPALLARVFLLVSWPAIMTSWPVPHPGVMEITSATTKATPLGVLAEQGTTQIFNSTSHNLYLDLFLGNRGGCLGETSVIALLIGGLFLLYRKRISWHIPISYITTVFIISGIYWLADKTIYADPLFHILAGGLFLGAFFMATDMVTSPLTKKGHIVFGIGCGIITIFIRIFGAYPEGVSFSILIMNAFVPIIDRYTKPKRYGVKELKNV